jgi:hypothetical protein
MMPVLNIIVYRSKFVQRIEFVLSVKCCYHRQTDTYPKIHTCTNSKGHRRHLATTEKPIILILEIVSGCLHYFQIHQIIPIKYVSFLYINFASIKLLINDDFNGIGD